MKKISNIILSAVSIIAVIVSMASCIEGNDIVDTTMLSHQDKVSYVSSVVGNYSGKLYYLPNFSEGYYSTTSSDSVSVELSISAANDTTATIVCEDFPVRVVGKFKSLVYDLKSRNILSSSEPQRFIASLTPFFYDDSYHAFWLYPYFSDTTPQELDYMSTFDGNEYLVSLVFSLSPLQLGQSENYSAIQYPMAIYNSSSHKFSGSLLLKSVTVNGSTYNLNTFMTLVVAK